MAGTTVSLEWLLAQHDLGLRLVAGVPARERLTWAHASDLLDPTPWLTGGELVLTTGIGLPPSVDEQRAYVGRLADTRVAGLGFGAGVRYAAIPAPIVAACSERKFPLLEVPLPTPFIAITQAVARRIAQQEVASLQQALTYQRRISRSAIRTGLAGVVSVLSKELRCEAVVLDEYAAVMASSVRQGGLLELVGTRWDELVPDARRGIVGVTTEHGILEIQTLRGRAAVVGWLAVQRATSLSPTDRLLLNQAVSLVTLQLDWPAELIAAYHSLGGTLLDLLLDPAQDAAMLVRHLRHFGFEAGGPVVLTMVTAPCGHRRLLGIVSDTLERASRPHVLTLVEGGVAVLLMTRDAADPRAGRAPAHAPRPHLPGRRAHRPVARCGREPRHAATGTDEPTERPGDVVTPAGSTVRPGTYREIRQFVHISPVSRILILSHQHGETPQRQRS